jgi:hypothetical protein
MLDTVVGAVVGAVIKEAVRKAIEAIERWRKGKRNEMK